MTAAKLIIREQRLMEWFTVYLTHVDGLAEMQHVQAPTPQTAARRAAEDMVGDLADDDGFDEADTGFAMQGIIAKVYPGKLSEKLPNADPIYVLRGSDPEYGLGIRRP